MERAHIRTHTHTHIVHTFIIFYTCRENDKYLTLSMPLCVDTPSSLFPCRKATGVFPFQTRSLRSCLNKAGCVDSWMTQLDESTVNSVGDDLQQADPAQADIRIQLPWLVARPWFTPCFAHCFTLPLARSPTCSPTHFLSCCLCCLSWLARSLVQSLVQSFTY